MPASIPSSKSPMPNFAAVIKQEIVRLARKEVRAQTEKLRRAALQHRKSIAALNRAIQELRRQLTLAGAQARRSASAAPSGQAATRLRFSAARLRSQRKRLGLSAEAFARLAGVSSQTIYNWEHGVTRPAARQLAALAQVRKLGKREARQQLERLAAPGGKKRPAA